MSIHTDMIIIETQSFDTHSFKMGFRPICHCPACDYPQKSQVDYTHLLISSNKWYIWTEKAIIESNQDNHNT